MALKKIGKVLAGIAPIAASALTGGAFGPVAAGIAGSVKKALNLDDNATPEDIEAAVVAADPSQLAQLRKIEADAEKDLAEIGFKKSELVYKDRASARRRQVALKDATPAIFAWITLGGFLGVTILLFAFKIEGDSKDLLHVSIGALGTLLAQIGAYYFGSSAGGDAAGEALHRFLEDRKVADQ